MDQIFDRLGNLLRSLFQEEDAPRTEGARRASGDPDLETAWEELDEFLRTGENRAGSDSRQSYGRASSSSYRPSTGPSPGLPEEIRRDYANLEVPVTADMETVRKAYHKLIRQYHPDHFAANPKKLKDATEITQKINQSYQRIKKYRETGKL